MQTQIPPFSVPLAETGADQGNQSVTMSPSSSAPTSPASRRQSTIRAKNPESPRSIVVDSKTRTNSAYFDLPIRTTESPVLSFPKPPAAEQAKHSRQASYSSTTESFATSQGYADSDAGVEDAPLFILQPRTYTPLPPEPLPSPMVREAPKLNTSKSEQPLGKKSSLRQRISLKTTPPEAIVIPQPHPTEFEAPSYGSAYRQSPDSAYGSDDQHIPRFGTIAEMSPPVRPPVMASPRSDQHQFYRPVQASPHSPLQQRPLTAGAAPRPAPQSPSSQSMHRPGHQRNAPSRMGGASMLSTVTTMTYDSQATNGEKKLKKKRSAFGWLKKAFSLDEEERMAYEARKQLQMHDPYYEARSPKYIDGRRVR